MEFRFLVPVADIEIISQPELINVVYGTNKLPPEQKIPIFGNVLDFVLTRSTAWTKPINAVNKTSL